MIERIVDATLGKWLEWWHGVGEAWQYQFYRCHECRRLVTHHVILAGGCRCRGGVKVSPTYLSAGDKARLLFMPWTVTSLKTRKEALSRPRA